jgi:hypothetical protein
LYVPIGAIAAEMQQMLLRQADAMQSKFNGVNSNYTSKLSSGTGNSPPVVGISGPTPPISQLLAPQLSLPYLLQTALPTSSSSANIFGIADSKVGGVHQPSSNDIFESLSGIRSSLTTSGGSLLQVGGLGLPKTTNGHGISSSSSSRNNGKRSGSA